MITNRKFLVAFGLLVSGVVYAGSDVPRLAGVVLETPPVIDGILSEGEWAGAALGKGFIDPYTGAEPADKTEVWLAYDEEAIYVAFYAYDSNPAGIVVQETQIGSVDRVGGRGMMSSGGANEDIVQFEINPFNNRSYDLSSFRVNAAGTTGESISGGRTSKREWRGEWQGAAKIVEGGWTAEMRIPWKIMNLPKGQSVNMDINFARHNEADKVDSFWANLTLRRLPEHLGVWESVNPPAQKAENRLQWLGYVAPEYNENEEDEFQVRAGVDMRYKISNQMSSLVSINPDFKNIEQQVTSIAFSRSERFERDNRPFFTEGSGFFGSGGGGMRDSLFHSRRISDFDIGAKAYGNITNTEGIGVLATVEDGDDYDMVASYEKILGPRSNLRLFASGSDDEFGDNVTYSGQLGHGQGNFYMSGRYSVAVDDGVSDSSGGVDISYNVPRFSSNIGYSWVDPDFSPGLGFVRFDDRRGVSFFASYNDQYRSGGLRSFSTWVFGNKFDKYDGSNQQKGIGFRSSVTTRSDLGFSLGGEIEQFEDEEEQTVSVGFDYNVSNRFKKFGIDYNFGERDGENTEFFSFRGSYRLPIGIDLGLSHSFLDFLGYTDQTILTLGWEIDPKQSLTARFVSQSGSENFYLAYQSSGDTGMDWFLIIGDPNAKSFSNRISLKFVWAR